MSGIPLVVHPQAILQIADQVSRSPFFDPPRQYLCGFLLGACDGPRMEIHSAIEVEIVSSDSGLSIHRPTFRTLLRQHQNIFPTEIPIGWYTCAEYTPEQVSALREAFEAIDHTEEYVRGEFLADRDSPFCLYTSVGDAWAPVEYAFESELAERIAMMQLQAEGTAESQVQFTADAYRSLDQHLAAMEDYLLQIAEGKREFDPVAARECANVCQWWTHSRDISDSDMVLDQEKLALFVGAVAEAVTNYSMKLRNNGKKEEKEEIKEEE